MSPENESNEEKDLRVGVYVCHCGTNIAGMVDVEDVRDWSQEKLGNQGVVISRDYKFMCSSLGQELIENDIQELGLNRVVVAACSPHLHEKTLSCSAGDRRNVVLVFNLVFTPLHAVHLASIGLDPDDRPGYDDRVLAGPVGLGANVSCGLETSLRARYTGG